MHPVLRRVLLHGGLTAVILAVVGVMFAELATVWLIGNAPRGAGPGAGADAEIGPALRVRVPLMLSAWGFLFVLVGELVIWRVRRNRPPAPKPPDPQDEAEKLLNELLAQAEAKMAAEAEGSTGNKDHRAENSEKTENGEQPSEDARGLEPPDGGDRR